MSTDSSAALGPLVAYALIALYRALRRPEPPKARGKRELVDPRPRLHRVVPPPSAATVQGETKATLQHKWPLPEESSLVVPVEGWERDDELIAWRFWKLGRLTSDGGIRLLSFRPPFAWDGPVLRAHRLPSESPFSCAGVYALKAAPPANADVLWSDECWVSGWVALSGRVVEHEQGYRAEQAVIRALRLGVGTHLRVLETPDLLALAAELERRYQAPVDLGAVERGYSARVLKEHGRRWGCGVPEIPEGCWSGERALVFRA